MIGHIRLVSSRRFPRVVSSVAYFRAITVVVSLICAVAGCHHEKLLIVLVEIFEDHVSVDGVRSESSIQQAIKEQTRNPKVLVTLIPRQPLSAERIDQLTHASEKLHPGIGIRRVQLECLPSTDLTCP